MYLTYQLPKYAVIPFCICQICKESILKYHLNINFVFGGIFPIINHSLTIMNQPFLSSDTFSKSSCANIGEAKPDKLKIVTSATVTKLTVEGGKAAEQGDTILSS